MEYSTINGIEISKLTLGTVALGMDYGTFQDQQRPDDQERQAILTSAFQAGINTFDTARGYGDAEQLLGGFLTAQEAKRPLTIVTKFKVDSGSKLDYNDFRTQAYESVRGSLENLHLDQLPVCLFHMVSSFDIHEVLQHLKVVLMELKRDELIKMGGISIDHPLEAEHCIDVPEIEAMQIPMNVFDQRLVETGLLDRLQASGKMVFARSVFLRGLFFQRPDQLTAGLIDAVPYLEKLQELADRSAMSVAQFAFSYIRDLEGITSIVFGAEKASQINDNVLLLKGDRIPPDIRAEAERFFQDVPEWILTPRSWSI